MHRIYRYLAPLNFSLMLLLLAGCVSLSTERLANNLSNAMLNQTDPEIVRAGAPAYLLLIDSLIEDSPNDPNLLLAGARLYGAYGGGLISDPVRQKGLALKTLDYASRGICINLPAICASKHLPHREFVTTLGTLSQSDLEGIYVFGASWLGWIQTNSDDWSAVAELSKAEAVLQKVVDLEPGFEHGRAQLYLGVIRSLIPPAVGGKPEVGREHFENAIKYSGGKDLIIKLEFARRYARLVFNRELHDQLLHEVIDADPVVPGLTLSNVLAQQQAKQLLAEDYF
ncbi:MAG: TRAP transporter TatT component family protein [Pseudomonadota bacterium]